MEKFINFYRSDHKGNKTFPEKYTTDGLFSKQLNSKDHPKPHEKYGWLKTIKSHIRPTNELEKFIYGTTQYLSFTTDFHIAEFYLATQKNLKFHKSTKESADAFLFSAIIPESKLQYIGKGVYLYLYKCNYDKTLTDPKFISNLSGSINCNICSYNHGYNHRLILIDSKLYLSDQKNLYPEEYALALKDNDWLFMPVDPMVGTNALGFQSRIPVADFWTVDFYKYDQIKQL